MTVDGFVLAGGESRRFGQDKALFRLLGTTLVEGAIATLSDAGCERVVALHRRPSDLSFLDCEVATDHGGGRGPLDGVHTALMLSRSPFIITLPVDQPFVTSHVLRQLLAVASADSDVDLVSIVDDLGSHHHLTAVWRTNTSRSVVDEHVLRGESSPRRVLENLRCRWVEVPAATMHNLNRPEDVPTRRPTLTESVRHDVDKER